MPACLGSPCAHPHPALLLLHDWHLVVDCNIPRTSAQECTLHVAYPGAYSYAYRALRPRALGRNAWPQLSLGHGLAALQDELVEAAAVCRLIVAGTLEDVLDAGKRAALPRMDLPRLAAILPKYRRATMARCSACWAIGLGSWQGSWPGNQAAHTPGWVTGAAAQAGVAML